METIKAWLCRVAGEGSHSKQTGPHKAPFQGEACHFYDPAPGTYISLSQYRSVRARPHHSIKEFCDPIDLKYLEQG